MRTNRTALFSNRVPRRWRSWPWRTNSLAIIGALAVVVAGVHWLRNDTSSSPSSGAAEIIAVRIGADACTQTGYRIVNRLDESRSTIYDCTVGAEEMCVTEHDGLVNDSTAAARLLFASVLSGGRPACAA